MAELQPDDGVEMSDRDEGRRRRRCQRLRPGRIITLAIVFLLLGALVNIAVAWGIAIRTDGTSFGENADFAQLWASERYNTWSVSIRRSKFATRTTSSWVDKGAGGGGFGGAMQKDPAPLLPRWATMLNPSQHTSTTSSHTGVAWEFGWPKSSMGGSVVVNHKRVVPPENGVQRHFAIPLGNQEILQALANRSLVILPLRPLWFGFAINMLLYATLIATLWLLIFGPGMLRSAVRKSRLRRGQCPRCGYPMGESPRCTECGTPLPGR